jgi:hypothetical protein
VHTSLTARERFALWSIVGHGLPLALHSRAHTVLGIDPSPAQLAFIVAVIIAAPILAGALLLARRAIAGGMMLAGSMAGSFVFGLYYHFVAISSDHVAHLPAGSDPTWARVFAVSAVMMAAAAIPGAAGGVAVVRSAASAEVPA